MRLRDLVEVWQTLGGLAVPVLIFALARLRRVERLALLSHARAACLEKIVAATRADRSASIEHASTPVIAGPRTPPTPEPSMPKTAVVTRSFDNARTGANLAETVLTPAAVLSRGLRRAFVAQTTGDARGCEAQPLIVPGVPMADGETRDVLVAATMGNDVFAFDANDGTTLWSRRYGNPVVGSRAIDGYLINQYWGILGTPVVDAAARVAYCVMWQAPDGTVANAAFAMLKIALGSGDVIAQLDLSTATYAPGHGLPTQRFNAAARKQRCGLALDPASQTLYACFGTIAETSTTAQGWVIAVNAGAMTIRGAWTTTARGHGAGIWMAGQAPAIDAAGNVYLMTGNGDFDGVTDFGECFVRLAWVDGALACVDWWSPFSDAGREGENPVDSEPTSMAMPTNVRPIMAMNMGDFSDMDLGSGGVRLDAARDELHGAGKDGILYPVRMSSMGKTMPGDFANPAANYARLKSAPTRITFYAPGVSAAPASVEDLNFLLNGFTHHQHSTTVGYTSARNGDTLFTMGENAVCKAYVVAADGVITWIADGAVQASAQCVNAPGGMPGGMLSLSASGNTGGVLWCVIPYGDANSTITNGRLIAYDAEDFTGGTLKVLWDSQAHADAFVFNKFNIGVAANGTFYLPTYDGKIVAYVLA